MAALEIYLQSLYHQQIADERILLCMCLASSFDYPKEDENILLVHAVYRLPVQVILLTRSLCDIDMLGGE